jgi:uncharacterized damage-inducible protein DinB
MHRRAILLVWVTLLAACATAQEPAGVRGWALRELNDLESKLVRLAEKAPAEKYTWRPGDGVRSMSEVYLHVASANYGLPSFLGVKPPEGVDRRGLEKSTTERAKVVEHLKNSFAHVKGAITKLPDADLSKPVKLFGRDATYQDVVLLLVTHTHEHLGQSIAYARSNGIVPPWSEK